jgi:translation initiation factor 1A
MVKNTHGGSGHKKFARKHTTGSKGSSKLRTSESDGEIYAVVTKMLGNGMFHCYCIDEVTRLGHIRGKFSKRGGKRDNMVEAGKWVLIGLREWDISPTAMASKSDKIQQCDLLEVFNDSDKIRLKDTVEEEWHLLDGNDPTKNRTEMQTTDASDIVFTTSKDLERQQLMAEMDSSIVEKIVFKIGDGDAAEEDVDVSDI